jgi:lysyl-tRNA synthetase class 2
MQGKYEYAGNEVFSRYRTLATPFIASLTILYALLLGILNITRALGFHLRGFVYHIERSIHVATGMDARFVPVVLRVFMLFLAYELWLRKRAALLVLLAFLVVESAAEIRGSHGLAVGVTGLFVSALLLTAAGEFPARPDPALIRRFKLALPVFAVLFLCFGAGGLYLLRGNLGVSGGVYALAHKAVTIPVGKSGLDFDGWAVLYRDSLIILTILGLVYLVVLLFRPYREREERGPEQSELAGRLVERYGSDSLAYFNLRDGKNFFFHTDRIFLAYRQVGDVAVISGDPVGPSELVSVLLAGFRAYCAERGWRITSVGSSEEFVRRSREIGLKGFEIGEEAIIDLDGFSLEGRRVRKLRQSVNKLDRMGVTMEFVFNAGIPSHMKHELCRISADWRGGKPETGYSMGLGRLMNSQDPDCLLSVAYDADTRPIGFLHLVPMYPHIGYSLDVTRTMNGAPNALSEFMLARTALFLKEQGYREMSLHFLAFSQHYREDRREPGAALWRAVAKVLDHVLPVVSVYRFDKKFCPMWKKRYIAYRSLLDFPAAAFAIISSESALKVTRPEDRKGLTTAS